MQSLLFLLSVVVPLCSGRPISLFHLSFQEFPARQSWSRPSDTRGATPADTYPLVLKPYSFAPAVVAPPSWLYPAPIRGSTPFGTRNQILGAIPLFRPFLSSHFSNYLNFAPVSTTFYLSEPNTRFQQDLDHIPYKKLSAAPLPAFIPIRDVQINHEERVKYVQPEILADENVELSEDEIEFQNYVDIRTVPQQVGPLFEFRGDNDLKLSAPGGIVQSGQPNFSKQPFFNSKVSDFLMRSGMDEKEDVVLV